jgi:PPOX class probable F420-dependent enzyme
MRPIGENAEWDEFVSKHRWAVLTTLRSNGQPVSSVVAYAREGEDLVISTPLSAVKSLSIERDPRVNLCVLSNAEPINFVAIEAHATVEHADLVDSTRLVFQNIADTIYQEPEDLEGWIEAEERVILRLQVERAFGVIR